MTSRCLLKKKTMCGCLIAEERRAKEGRMKEMRDGAERVRTEETRRGEKRFQEDDIKTQERRQTGT